MLKNVTHTNNSTGRGQAGLETGEMEIILVPRTYTMYQPYS